MSLTEARRLAAQLLDELTAAKIKTLPKPTSPTVNYLFEQYYTRYVQHQCRTAPKIRYYYNKYLSALGDIPADELTPADITQHHAQLSIEHGPTMANRAIQGLRAIFSYAEKHWLYNGRNPTRAVRLNKEHKRRRFVEHDEMPRLLAAIEQYATPKTRDFFKMCLYTGQRFRNVCMMRWEHINMERALWVIPASQFKNGETHIVPLPSAAIEILRARKDQEKNGWVFPSRRGAGHLRSPYRYWYEIREKAGLDDLTIHDLRRTLATYQTAAGASLTVVGDTLGHSSVDTTLIYARVPRKTARDAIEAAINGMNEQD